MKGMRPVYQNNLVGMDSTLKRNEWKEMARLLGMPGVKYFHFVEGTKRFTIHSEIQGEYSEPIEIPMIWMDVPDQETATTLGWLSEIANDKPYIAQLPWDTPHLETGCRLQIPFVGDSTVDDESNEGNMFRITRVYVMSRFPNCRMVQLAPEFKSSLRVDPVNNDEEKNYGFLKVDENA